MRNLREVAKRFKSEGQESAVRGAQLIRRRACNLCGDEFSTPHKYRVFCDRCRIENELYLYSEWLPEGVLDDAGPLVAKWAA